MGTIDPTTVSFGSQPYWADLGRLIAIFALWKSGRIPEARDLEKELSDDMYHVYVADKMTGR